MSFEFHCGTCGKMHKGMPSFGPDAPFSYYCISETERSDRCELGTDECIIDENMYFVRGRLQIPVHSILEPFTWLVWCSLSLESFKQWLVTYDQRARSGVGPFFGWLNTRLPFYDETLELGTKVHLQDNFMRPLIELEPTDHPLAVAQRDGISVKLAEEMIVKLLHPDE